MAPPIPLSTVAGTLALSFTTGRAAPATASPPVQQPTSVPAPPTLPPVPGETDAPDATEPATTEPATAEPATATNPATTRAPAPEPTPAPPTGVEPEWEPPSRSDEDAPTPAARLLRPNRSRFTFSLFAGSSKGLRGGYSYVPDFKLEGALGGHDPSFRLGGFMVIQVASGPALNSFTFAPRLSLNRQIVPNHAFYFTTNMTVGYRLALTRDDGNGYGSSDSREALHGAVLGVGWGASAIVAERLLLSFRPLDLELVVPAPDTLLQVNLSFMGGVGVVWGNDDDR